MSINSLPSRSASLISRLRRAIFPSKKSKRWFHFTPYLWILPAIVALALFMFYPISFSTILSFYDWDGYQQDPFANPVGLENFINLLQDELFLKSLKNTLLFVFAIITVQIAISFLLAVFIYTARFRGSTIIRAIIFFPSVLSAVVVGIVWRNVVFLRGALIHQITNFFGLPDFFPMADPNLAFYMIIIVAMWQGIGFNLVIFYAGLQSLDQEVLESAQIDGAGYWQLIWKIITPLQRPVILTNVMLNLIGGFQIFDLVFVMSGPMSSPLTLTHATDVLTVYMIFNSFRRLGYNRFGYASAIAVVLMIMTLIFSALRSRVRRAFA